MKAGKDQEGLGWGGCLWVGEIQGHLQRQEALDLSAWTLDTSSFSPPRPELPPLQPPAFGLNSPLSQCQGG